MSVTRYNFLAVAYYSGAYCEAMESEDGGWVHSDDYDALRERVAWMMECTNGLLRYAVISLPYGMTDDLKESEESFYAACKAVEELLS